MISAFQKVQKVVILESDILHVSCLKVATTFDLSGSGTLSFCQKSSIYEENFENFT